MPLSARIALLQIFRLLVYSLVDKSAILYHAKQGAVMVSEKRSITTEKAIALLKKQGLEINPTEAELVVNFLYFLAEILTDENTENESS
jgi:hypothetical protein